MLKKKKKENIKIHIHTYTHTHFVRINKRVLQELQGKDQYEEVSGVLYTSNNLLETVII